MATEACVPRRRAAERILRSTDLRAHGNQRGARGADSGQGSASERAPSQVHDRVLSENSAGPYALSGRSVVVPQEPTKPCTAANRCAARSPRFGHHEPVANALVISFVMIVFSECRQRSPKAALTEEHQPIQTFFLIDLTNRSACALQFGARYGVCTTRIPASASRRRKAALHLVSRSQIKIRW